MGTIWHHRLFYPIQMEYVKTSIILNKSVFSIYLRDNVKIAIWNTILNNNKVYQFYPKNSNCYQDSCISDCLLCDYQIQSTYVAYDMRKTPPSPRDEMRVPQYEMRTGMSQFLN